jgi:protein SCO1/2
VPATRDDALALLRSLAVVVVPDGEGGFVHNGAIHLLDERGRLRGLFEFDQWPRALAAAHQLAATRRGGAE